VVGIDEENNNHFKAAMDNGLGRPYGSSNNDNGGNLGNGGGGCDTETAVGIDKEDNNHLKRQWTTGADGPEAAVES
jgi:hypothetical protein